MPAAVPAPAIPSEIAPPLTPALMRLHEALTQRDLWHALRLLARDTIPSESVTLEIGAADAEPQRVYRHAHPATPAELRRDNPMRHWLPLHPRAPIGPPSDGRSLRAL